MFKRVLYSVIADVVPNSLFTLRSITKLSAIYNSEDFYFVQIGANDGFLRDPIHHFIRKYHWKGVFVEPVNQYFDELKETYADQEGLFFENSAISDRDETRKIFKIREGVKHIAKWYKGVASLERKVLVDHKGGFPEIERYIEEQLVKCITLSALIDKYRVKKIDLLCIDTEGHEAVILRQLPGLGVRPETVYYEHKHLSDDAKMECQKILTGLGYTLSKKFQNTLAYLG